MLNWKRSAKINVKVLIILIIVTVALGASLFTARQIRRSFLSKMALKAGQEAYEKEDWRVAFRNFMEYLGRNPDDIEILKKYAKAGLSIRPLNPTIINRVIAAYRQVIRLDPKEEIPYDKLAMLYTGTGNYEELAYVARTRMKNHDPNEPKAMLWLGEALNQLNKTEAKKVLNKLITNLDGKISEKHPEYVRACLLMSQIILEEDSYNAEEEALSKFIAAVKYDPNSVEALGYRAWFYRQTATNIPGTKDEKKQEYLDLAQKDLENADTIGTENPRIRFFLASEWIAHGELDRAANELKAAENLPKETIQEHYLDLNQWTVEKFQLAAELAIRTKNYEKGITLVKEILNTIEDQRYREIILPFAIQVYAPAGKVADANDCLDEYVEISRMQEVQPGYRQRLPYLRALVAKAKDDSYAVIDILQPAVMSDDSNPSLWGLLAEAFSRTDQPRRAVNAFHRYLRLNPKDFQMTLQLAKEYIKLQDWNNAYRITQIAETMNPTDIVINLLQIETTINIVAKQETIDKERLLSLADELKQLREKHSERVDTRILQAIISEYLERPEEAEKELKLAIEECDEPLRAEIQLAGFYNRTGRLTKAIDTCLTACENNPEAAEPWLYLSSLRIKQKDYQSARKCLEDAQQTVTGKWEKRSILINLAILELMQGNRSLGIKLLHEVAAQDKREIRARTLLLSIREIQQDKATAQKLIDELREVEGESGLMWRLHQAEIWLESDQWRSKQQEIASYLQYCIDSDPEWSAPPIFLAKMYEKLDDYKHIEETYQQALIRNPSATDITDRLVTFLEKQGRFSEAENILQQTGADPKTTSALRIRAALSENDFDQAIKELKVRISNNNKDANSRILLARLIYWRDQDKDQALRYLDEAEAIDPGNIVLTAARVAILKAERQSEDAVRILNDYVEKYGDFRAYMLRASYLANENEFERAEKDYIKLTTFPEQAATGYELLSNFYFINERYDKAVEVIEQGLNEYPENLKLKRRLMKTLFVQSPAQDQQRALEILSELEEQLRQDPELMKLRAIQILNESPESIDVVREKLESVIKLEPTAVDAHLLLIDIMMHKGEYENARNHAIRAIGSNPNNTALLLARSRAEIELNNTRIAVQIAHTILQDDPNNAQVRDMISLAALRSKNDNIAEEAASLMKTAVPENPMDEKLLLSEISVLASRENPELEIAIPLLETYCKTEHGSNSINAIVTLADLYRLSGDMNKSRQLIEQAETIDPNNQISVHARFLWLIKQKRFEELENISSAYISAKEQNPTTIMKAATILITLDSIALKKEGLKLYQYVEAMSPTLLNEKMDFASVLYQTGDAEQAEKIYRELLQQDPNNIRILNDLAWILQEHSHRYADALELANKGLSLEDTNINLIDTRGTILSNLQGRITDARNDFEKLVQLSRPDTPQQARALLQLGRICVKLGDIEQAKQHLNKALEIDKKIDVDSFTSEELSEIKQILQNSR